MESNIITGFRPTNKLHIGNVFGALNQIENLENNHILLMLVDLHAMTEGTISQDNIYYNAKLFVSLMEGKNFTMYLQSQVEHLTELMWILASYCTSGDLHRMTQFKSKENPHCGFLLYPILMAADILISNATTVAVGKDQTQHMELTQKIANNFNKQAGKDIFVIPDKKYIGEVIITDLQDSSKKMSKTSTSSKGVIFLSDSPEDVKKKILKAKTDSLPMPENIAAIKHTRKEIYNLCLIFSFCKKCDFPTIEKQFAGKNISLFKKELYESINSFLQNIRNKCENISHEQIDELFKCGQIKINTIAKQVMAKVKNTIYI